jgi:hypothetical protein
MIAPEAGLSVSRQCALLAVARSSFYYRPRPERTEELELLERLDRGWGDLENRPKKTGRPVTGVSGRAGRTSSATASLSNPTSAVGRCHSCLMGRNTSPC